jgi:hypothetical protein
MHHIPKSTQAEFVLGKWVTMVLGFDDEAGPYAEAVLDLMPTARAHVPALWPLKVANAFSVGERRSRTTPADTAKFLSLLGIPLRAFVPSDYPSDCGVPTMVEEQFKDG